MLFLAGVAQLLEFAHDTLALFPGGAVLTLKSLVAGHHVSRVIQGGEKFSQCGRLGNEDKNVESAVLFHGAHSRPVTAKLLILHGPGLLDLDGLLGNGELIDSKLSVQDFQRGLPGLHLFLQGDLLLQDAGFLILQTFDPLLGLFGVSGKLFLLLLQLVDLLLLNGKSSGKNGQEQRKDHDHCHHEGQD